MKVAVIGGGSTYTPELLDGLFRRRAELDLHEVHLHDVDPGRLELLGRLGERMAARSFEHDRATPAGRSGVPVAVRWGTDRSAAVAGSSFVVSQIRVGGMAARERDELLGREFDLIGQETVGVGGLANAWRTIPVAVDIARDVARHAPDAVLLNFTNPAGLVTEALWRAGDVAAIGLCNAPWTMRVEIATALDEPLDDVVVDSVGLNHLSWVRQVQVRGIDRTADALDAHHALMERRASATGSPTFTREAYEVLGAIPNSYQRYYYDTPAMLAHQREHPTRASTVQAIEHSLLAQYADPTLDHKPAELDRRGGAHYSEAAAALMADLVGTPAGAPVRHVVDVPSAGAIPGFPDEAVVEIAIAVGGGTWQPCPTDPLPPEVDALMRTMKDVEQLAVQAALTGDENAALRALVTHPLGPSVSQVHRVWARLRELNAGCLGALDR
ncbi:MAG: hypothetical protein R2713_15600 [Ilumatobacteraceae bacterium]